MENVMLDLETMSTKPHGAIIAIGAVEFDLTTQQIGNRFYEVIDLKSSAASGGVIDASTVLWWLAQSEDARALFKQPSIHLVTALHKFTGWMKTNTLYDAVKVWGNSASFDNVILANAYKSNNLSIPWKFKNDRCYRTIVQTLAPELLIQREGIFHNALNDAENQANHLIKIMNKNKQEKVF